MACRPRAFAHPPQRLSRRACAVALAISFPAASAIAQQPAPAAPSAEDATPAPDKLLQRIVVTAGPGQVARTAGSVHFIDAETLDKSASADINRVLRQVPGLNIVEEEGFGIRPNIGIRGSGTDRNSKIAVMEDGVLIAPAPYAAPAAYYFPRMPRMAGVEVTKGPAAIKYGPQTVAGAINLFSTPIPDKPEGLGGKVELLGGAFGTTRAHGVVGGYIPTGNAFDFGMMLETLQEKSAGFKKLDSGGNTGYDIEDYVAKLALRSAAGARFKQSLELKLQQSEEVSDETYLGLTLDDFRADPFRRYRGSQVDRMNVDHRTYQLTHRIDFGNRVDLTTTAYRTETTRVWYKLNDVLDGGALRGISSVLADPAAFATAYQTLVGAGGFVSANDALRVRNNNREYYASGVQSVLGVGFDVGAAAHQVEASVRFHRDEEDRFQRDDRYRMDNGTMVLTSLGAPGSQDNRVGAAKAWALFVRDTIDWNRWTVVPGIRYETIDLTQTRYGAADPNRTNPTNITKDTVDVWVPGLGAMFRLTDHWNVLAGAHRGFGSPAPGSNASPEKSWNYEAGVRFADLPARFEAIGFLNDFSNLVGTCTASSGGNCTIGDQFNGGKARAFGLELTTGYDAGRRLGWGVSVPLTAVYTYTKAEFRNAFQSGFEEWGTVLSGDDLPYVPKHQLAISAGLEGSRWRTLLTMSYVGEARSRAGSGSIPATQRVDSRTLLDLSAEVDVTRSSRVFASVLNLTDEQYNVGFRPAGARPGVPRTFIAGVKVDL